MLFSDKKILFLDTVHPILKEKFQEKGFVIIENYSSSKTEILAQLKTIEGIIIRSRMSIDAAFLEAAPNLRWIARSGSGLENIHLELAKQRKIEVFNSPEGNRDAVAEQVIGMLIGLFRHLKRVDIEVREKIWQRSENRGLELKGKTLAIIGYGNVGKSLAKKLSGFEMNLIAHDPYLKISEPFVRQVEWEEIFLEADIISLHVPLTLETQNLIRKETLKKFKKSIFLINTARGSCVNTSDLLDSIAQKKVLGAALDVFDFEEKSFEQTRFPIIFERLKTCSQVLLSPHVAGWTHESYQKLALFLWEKIWNFYKNQF